jgi:hypothetical protein
MRTGTFVRVAIIASILPSGSFSASAQSADGPRNSITISAEGPLNKVDNKIDISGVTFDKAGPIMSYDLSEGANFQFFEQIIPISQVVAELDKQKPTWKSDFGVRLFGQGE